MKNTPIRAPGALALVAAALGLWDGSPALAQEAMYTASATMPSPHTYVYRPMFHYWRYGTNPVTGDQSTDRFELYHSLAYGIERGLAAYIEIPLQLDLEEDAAGERESDPEIDRIEAYLKYRIFQNDSGGINTLRVALMGGATIDADGDGSVNPKIGAALTTVQGRHGFNQDMFFTLNTGGEGDRADNFGGDGPDEAIHHSSAYVFRFWPERFAPDSRGAWYATVELTGLYETGGDYELFWAPGVMYEGYRWAFEAMAKLPVYEDVQDRSALSFGVGFGLRFSL